MVCPWHNEQGMITRIVFISFATVLLFASLHALAQSAPKPIKIVLVGDSTVQPSSVWGPGFEKMLRPEAKSINWAKGGRSSKSFIDEGWWEKALAEKPD